MSCTTMLVGKNASYNGSTMIARNDDSGSGCFTPKKFVVISPEKQKELYGSEYVSVISHVHVALPDNPARYTAMPNALKGEGVWAAAGVNEFNVSMTATETITSNERVLGADPLVEYVKPGEESESPYKDESEKESINDEKRNDYAEEYTSSQEEKESGKPGGIGEEDIVTIVLPYIRSAREGVKRLGELLEKYGTYEMNGIAFSDVREVWIMETVGGHHWIAKKVPDDCYVVMPNQLWTDEFDLDDALNEQRKYMCSRDMESFIRKYHLDLANGSQFNPRSAFGSQDDADHCYNTPRTWFAERYLNPGEYRWDGEDADFIPESDDLPWALIPEKKITPEDVKYVLSSHYQGTPYDPYGRYGDHSRNGMYRSIGINRNDFMSITEIRPDSAFYYGDDPENDGKNRASGSKKSSDAVKKDGRRAKKAPGKEFIDRMRSIEWVAFGSNAFNVMVPFYTEVSDTPVYLKNTGKDVSTDNFYWVSRLIAALADASYSRSLFEIERYTSRVQSKARQIINETDDRLFSEFTEKSSKEIERFLEDANERIAGMLEKEASEALNIVLKEASNVMKNQYSRSDA